MLKFNKKKIKPRKILVIRFSSLGDIILTSPMLAKLRKAFPEARIDMVVKKVFSDAVRGNPSIDRLIEFDHKEGFKGLWKFIQETRKENYDLFVDVHRSLRSRLLLLFVSGIKLRYDKDTWRRLALLKLRWNIYDSFPRKIEDYMKPLRKIGVDARFEASDHTLLTFSKENQQNAKELAEKLCLEKKIPIQEMSSNKGNLIRIGIAPGAAHFLKKWPLEKYRELVYVLSDSLNVLFYVFGGPDDFECEHLGSLPQNIVNLQGRLSLKESASLIAICDLFIGNDSGLSHVAEAVGVDAYVFFGPTSRHFGFYPYRPGSYVFDRELSCRPCSRNGKGKCKNPSLKKCLEDISSHEVATKVLEYFESRKQK